METGHISFRPTGLDTRRTTGVATGSLLGQDLSLWQDFVARVNAAGGKILADSGSPYDYAYLSGALAQNTTLVAAMDAYNAAVTALRGAQAQAGGGAPLMGPSLTLMGLPTFGTMGGARMSDVMNQTDDEAPWGPRKQVVLADELDSLPGPPVVKKKPTLREQLRRLS